MEKDKKTIIIILLLLLLLWWWWKNRKPKAEPVILKNVNFDFNTSNLRPESQTELNKLADLLLKNQNTSVNIVGHTDSIGNDAYNLNLSKQRAETVVNYLINKGIDGKRLIAIGKGESEPLATNETEEGRAINRRVEYILNSELKL